ncbi:TauD/TfdA family dioxygenase [Sphaerisporangium sp. TRM90804]|uniref:TauD/TfdA family dioxygenase n=1 Tax=Sphaerisporangium sp. TRM90804 TaxID=3031113 RepID=UPI0024472E67|nr:TauD/TfdA family dioxygenase [Sphaerisporangium sp. TRM90804]MDH2426531.1 TauD/TfdA family dioxygenase [Sphaerisporangium sp. TRM90804]
MITQTPASHIAMDAADTAAVRRAVLAVRTSGDQIVNDPATVAAARNASDTLPLALRRALREFRRHSGPTGSLLLRGMPVEEDLLPATPSVDGSVQHSLTGPAAVLMLVASALGDPIAFRAEKSGALVQDVVPVPGKEEFQGNAGSVMLSFHNENAFHEHRPDYVMLLCLRPDHERVAGLRTACSREVLPLLTVETRRTLFLPEFVTEAPPSFGANGDATTPHGVLSGAPEDPDMRVDLAATTPLTQRAKLALAELGEVFDRTARSARLVTGDLAIVDNRVTVHGRTAFRPRYDGQDRWLQRTFVAVNLRRSRDHRPADGHVLSR